MARTGRPRTPTHLKLLAGSRNIPATADMEPLPTDPIGDPPAQLSELAQRYWVRKVAQCSWLTAADTENLMLWSVAMAMYEEAMHDIGKHGVYVKKNSWTKTTTYKSGKQTITQFDGTRMRSPAEEVMNRQVQVVAKLGSDLGFSPVGRTRIIVPPKRGQKETGEEEGSGNRFANNAAHRG